MKFRKIVSIIMAVLFLLPAIPVYATSPENIDVVFFDWSDDVYGIPVPYEEGKPLSYYKNIIQEDHPACDSFNIAGVKLHDADTLLKDDEIINADMCYSDTQIIWLETVRVSTVLISWSDADSEPFSFEQDKPLSYYTNQIQNIPIPEGKQFTGWVFRKDSINEGQPLNIDDVIIADMYYSEIPEIIWIEAVFEEIIPEPTPSDKEDNMNWYWMMLMMLQNTKYDVTATVGEGGTITNAGTSKVKYGNSITYIITPNEGYEIESVKVNGKEMGAITEYTFKNVRSKQNISATFKKVVEPEWVNPFTDISKSDDYYAAIEFVFENNLFKGTSDTTFAPNTTMSRGMFVTVLGRLAKVDVSAYTDVAFDDVIADQYYAPYVAWAVEKGITLGYGDGTFGVDDEVTIEQAIVFIARFAKLCDVETDFSDIDFTAYADVNDVSEWAFIEMLWALENGIYDVDEAILNPQGKAARWLVAEMIYNFCGNYEIIE